jgi:hypothetical protein
VDRVIHIVTWCGGGDNATIVMASLSGGGQKAVPINGIDAWTPGIHHELPDTAASMAMSSRWPRSESRRSRRQDFVPHRRDHAPPMARPQDARSPAVTIEVTDDDSQASSSKQPGAAGVLLQDSSVEIGAPDAGGGSEDRLPDSAAVKAKGDPE